MYIKNIFDIRNFKGLEDGYRVDFDDVTYLVGDNAKNKTTIGSIPLWILTGYNLYGNNRENVANDKNKKAQNTIASMTIIDNNGSEHIISRCKGKDNFVMLDGIRTTQEILTRFYKDVHAFICAYNPYYFGSLSQAEQKELLLRILPVISCEDAFELLENDEKEILGDKIVDIKGFCKTRRQEIKQLEKDFNQAEGSKNTYTDIAIQKEETLKVFEKEAELANLEEQYRTLITDSNEIVSIEDLENDIKKLENKIANNINIELKNLQEKQKNELEKLENVNSATSTCPTCKQEIKNENLIKALTISYKKNINNLAKSIEDLKTETKELMEKKDSQIAKLNQMKNPEAQEKTKKLNEIKAKIEILQKEKSEIALYNNEVKMKKDQISNAKSCIEMLNKQQEEITQTIDKYNNQIKIATKLYLLIIQEQIKLVSQYLNKVTIEFYAVDEETGEITLEDGYKIKYDGRDYQKLSKSYKLRADIEIAQLINKVTGINTMMFIDDVESITQIDLNSNIQTVLSVVIKYNDLEVLYSYQEVLERQKESINRKLQEGNHLLQIAA